MNHTQHTKHGVAIAPVSVGTTAITGTIDTLGYEYLEVLFVAATSSDTTAHVARVLAEGDTTSAYTNITELVGGTAFTMPAADTANATTMKFGVDLRKRKRYMEVTVDNAQAAIECVVYTLSRANGTPTTDALAGCTEIVYV